MTRVPLIHAAGTSERRRRKIERQLHALRVMEQHLNSKDIWLAVLTVPAVALLCILAAAKLHGLYNSFAIALAGAVAVGFAVWWIAERWVSVAWFIIVALIFIILEDAPSLGSKAELSNKPNRRQKLEKAIARREALLREMDRTASP